MTGGRSAAQKMRVTAKFTVLAKESHDWEVDALSKAMGIEQRKLLIFDVSLLKDPASQPHRPHAFKVVVGKIGTNWRILGGILEMLPGDE